MSGFKSLVAYVPEGVEMLGLGLVSAMFGRKPSGPDVRLTFCTDQPGPVMTDSGLTLTVPHGLVALSQADAVVLLAGAGPSTAVFAAARREHDRGALVAAYGSGVLALAAAGLLDGARATTHPKLAEELAAAYPLVTVEQRAVVDQGTVITAAGPLDLYLHLLRREHGESIADAVACQAVLPALRDDGLTSSPDEFLAGVVSWALANLHRPLSVQEMAVQAVMSPRTFARRFRAATGVTPHAWLTSRRLARAEHLLADTDLSIEQIARRVGYASGAVLREVFIKSHGVPPRDFRRRSRYWYRPRSRERYRMAECPS
ncbi:GlxA family transcriptional regulator [Micromonospora sp. NPDC000663]|uniref:GlxA family transcriptional regulator n=1 Tax=Micromonospora sp. NPDC000663 TaxID=3364218 RepID=UPI0036B0945B